MTGGGGAAASIALVPKPAAWIVLSFGVLAPLRRSRDDAP
jgi:hypothetical protein